MLSIQAGASMAKSLFPAVGATGATALRLALATLILVAVFRPWRMRVTRDQWPLLLFYGTSLGLMNLLFYKSLETVPLGIAVALEFTGPLAVALLGSRHLRDVGWVVLAVIGLVLLVPEQGAQALDPVGVAYALGAGACWAMYIVFGQKAGNAHGPQTVAIGSCIAAAVAVPFGVAHAGGALLAPALLPIALAVALLSTAIPYSLEMVALTKMPTRTFGMLMSLEPAIAALCGLLFLHERLSMLQWLAIASIIVASAGAAMTSRAPVETAGSGSA
ncbi:MAG: threonine/homoserine exporter RhtA [Archangium gephyra]|uniref:Threonine/homoserine exporter RhtA n=2 Tax=Pseudomonadati TaxID=3379134 RepID=A0A2W5SJ80_9BACT|nr:MAG: threonine/homoserine exporter RhtA [Archangium gephyra]